MKSYNDVANAVFEKRDNILEQKKRCKKNAVKIGLPVICLCIAAVAVLGIGKMNKTPNAPESVVSNVSQTVTSSEKEENKIVINTEFPELPNNSVSDFCVDINDYVPMTKDELRSFYGTEIFPRVPDDMAEYLGHLGGGEDRRYGIYRANGGTGDIIHDNQLILYVNREAQERRALDIEVSKKYRYMSVGYGSISSHDELTKGLDFSIINGVEVYIFYHSQVGYYKVNFIYNDTGFSIRADGFSEAEVIEVIESLTECGDKYKGNEYNPNPVLPMIRDFEGESLNAKIVPQNGTVYMTQSLQNAMEHYGDKAKYNVGITVFKSGTALDNHSDEVTAVRKRFSELGYIAFFEEYWLWEDNYKTVLGCHFSYEELKNFNADENHGYILYLYDE